MEQGSSLSSVFGGSVGGESQPEAITPPPAPLAADPGETGVPPAPLPQPPAAPADPFAKERAGLHAGMLQERRARQEAERRLTELGQRPGAHPQSPTPAPAPAADVMPVRTDYENADDYYRDYASWIAEKTVQQRMSQYEGQQRQRQEQERRQRQEQELQTRLVATVAAGEQKYPDFTAVINTGLAPYLAMSPALHEALIDLGASAHDVAYHLGKDPAEALRLAQVTGQRALDRELARLEVRVAALSQAPSPAPTAAAPAAAVLPKTLTQQRDARSGQFANSGAAAYDGPTPLSSIFARK